MSDEPDNKQQREEIPEESEALQDPVSIRKLKPLRVWPVVLLLVLMAAARFLPTLAEEESTILIVTMILGPVVLGVLILLWWVVFSRASALERIVGALGALLAAATVVALSHHTMRGPGTIIFTVPMGTAAFAIAAIVCGRYLSFNRTIVVVLAATIGFGFTALLRSDGMWGRGALDWYWRWEASAEEKMLAERAEASNASSTAVESEKIEGWIAEPDWPGFRGSDGVSQQRGPEIAVEWSTRQPREVWKISVGPGWSSFAVAGELLFTQEQLGDSEAVVCYSSVSGKEIWSQKIESRFEEALGGPGPRATPTIAAGGLFAMGASGQLQRLDPKTGDVVWMKDLRKVADRKPPVWGFSSSPLVVGSTVIVHAGGEGEKGTLAFDIESGDLKWSAAAGDHTYSSPHLGNLVDSQYVLMLTNTGLNILDPLSGDSLLDYEWKHGGYRALQPQVLDGNRILLPTQEIGTRCIRVERSPDSNDELVASEVWTSRALKPDFNDFVVFEGHAYGFNGMIFTCIDLSDGSRKWRGGRYGKGQVLLLKNARVLLVLSEKGEVLLLKADPTGHQELAKFNALDAKTWNHPVVIGDRLYVRNSEEVACFQLPLAEPSR